MDDSLLETCDISEGDSVVIVREYKGWERAARKSRSDQRAEEERREETIREERRQKSCREGRRE